MTSLNYIIFFQSVTKEYRTEHPWHLVADAKEKFDPDRTCEYLNPNPRNIQLDTGGGIFITKDGDQDLPPPPFNLTLMKGTLDVHSQLDTIMFLCVQPDPDDRLTITTCLSKNLLYII